MADSKEGSQTAEPEVLKNIILENSVHTKMIVNPFGAMVTGFYDGELPIFYPDGMYTTGNGEKRRGGMPILFPQSGAVDPNGEYPLLKQHGFGRDLPWKVEKVDGSEARLVLESNDETNRLFPYDFQATYIASLSEDKPKLHIQLDVQNNGDHILPLAPGFHPYFSVSNENKSKIKTNINGFDPKTFAWEKSQLFETDGVVVIEIPDMGTMVMQTSKTLPYVKIWSEDGMNYFCVEPVAAPNGALDSGKGRVDIQAHKLGSFFFSTEFLRK